ncbi:MAG: penicillin-binding protein 2 [Alistipes sp.]|nr:penicillin-binding protein 2 [Alistipes sp.]
MGERFDSRIRVFVLRIVVLLIFGTITTRLAYIQLFDGRYDDMARDNFLRYVVTYPSRGEVFDRNGNYLAQNRECYDVMVLRRDLPKDGFDTVRICKAMGIEPAELRKRLRGAPYRREHRITRYPISLEEKLRLDEVGVDGFYTTARTVRQYPRQLGGNLLGSLGAVSNEMIRRNPDLELGDFVGMEGLEASYEEVLRGEKGLVLRDIYAPQGARDSVLKEAVPGKSIHCSIDTRLQQLAEELLRDKVGAVVAIEPATGEILAMASSPTFNPDELVIGRERGNNYMRNLNHPRHPLWNRTVQSGYPPGSTFKLVNGLIGLQEGVLRPHYSYPCHKGYYYGDGHKLGCHEHASPLKLSYAISTSCNAYFCYVFRNILENKRYKNSHEGYAVWRDYVESFGFGNRLGSDVRGERMGRLPTEEFYDKKFKRWNALTLLSVSIGQGDLECTVLQMANLAATIANRGYYYTPHLVRAIDGCDSIDATFRTRHYTKIDTRHFETIVEGMWRAVNVDGTAQGAKLPGLNVCGKTGTSQNSRGEDHSTFISFAPRKEPKIAIAVYVEHGGFGAEAAVPIASLIEEMYLTDTIQRPWLVDYIKSKKIYYPMYDKKRK